AGRQWLSYELTTPFSAACPTSYHLNQRPVKAAIHSPHALTSLITSITTQFLRLRDESADHAGDRQAKVQVRRALVAAWTLYPAWGRYFWTPSCSACSGGTNNPRLGARHPGGAALGSLPATAGALKRLGLAGSGRAGTSRGPRP